MNATYAAIRDAILKKMQVTCDYKGLRREMCPHAIGWGKSGAEMVLSYQFAGETSSGRLPDAGEWRCMAIAEISNVQVRTGDWHTGLGHSRPQTCVKGIDVEVTH